ncbi:T-cell surface glycoprotein CD8 alpha chain isoform X1 [Austrofundulus limnaeus]|uniref:T-cell surface glycoprotein CD8 alpha chain n=1 Tax=Austrofundulus limnaeus TaxID=52670 RepID=A0A2I4BXT1_AUSLI|nr:PREDICTED: T-cell surface glycoprotein CD8 alpha chain isoform X1 [Austrofundulus limnaeus]
MDPKWIQVLVMLLFSQKINSASAHVAKAKEGKDVSIQCTPKKDGASMVIWFRVLDKSGMEFIASVALSGQLKKSAHYFDQIFRLTESHTLTLKSFKREDSGIYSCACLVGGNRLEFGAVTKLELEEEIKKATEAPAPQLTAQMTTTNKCDCKDKDQTGNVPTFCTIQRPVRGQTEVNKCLFVCQIHPCFVPRSSWAPWLEAVAFFSCSSSSPLYTATVS